MSVAIGGPRLGATSSAGTAHPLVSEAQQPPANTFPQVINELTATLEIRRHSDCGRCLINELPRGIPPSPRYQNAKRSRRLPLGPGSIRKIDRLRGQAAKSVG